MILKGEEVKEGKRRDAAEEIFKLVGVKVEIKEVRRVGEIREDGKEILLVKLGNEEQKWEVMEKKKF